MNPTIFKSPTPRNCARKSTYLTSSEIQAIEAGIKTKVEVFDKLENKKYLFDARDCLGALLDTIYNGERDTYRCFNYAVLHDSKLRPEHWTQEKVAAHFTVAAQYVCDLHKFNYLQPIAKNGRSLLYLKEDVLAITEDPRVQAWQKYCQGGRSIMKGGD